MMYLHCFWQWSGIISIINIFNNHALDNKRRLSWLWCLWLHDRFVLNYRAHYLLIAIKHAALEISPQLDGTHRFLCQLAPRCSLVWGEITRPCRSRLAFKNENGPGCGSMLDGRNNKGRAINCHPFMIFRLLPEQICPIDSTKTIQKLIH